MQPRKAGIRCLCSSGQPKPQSISLGINFLRWGGPLSLYLGERHFSLHLPIYCYWLQTQAERRRGDLWQLPKTQQAESRVPAIEGETKAQRGVGTWSGCHRPEPGTLTWVGGFCGPWTILVPHTCCQ